MGLLLGLLLPSFKTIKIEYLEGFYITFISKSNRICIYTTVYTSVFLNIFTVLPHKKNTIRHRSLLQKKNTMSEVVFKKSFLMYFFVNGGFLNGVKNA